jgi:hypothetical protein
VQVAEPCLGGRVPNSITNRWVVKSLAGVTAIQEYFEQLRGKDEYDYPDGRALGYRRECDRASEASATESERASVAGGSSGKAAGERQNELAAAAPKRPPSFRSRAGGSSGRAPEQPPFLVRAGARTTSISCARFARARTTSFPCAGTRTTTFSCARFAREGREQRASARTTSFPCAGGHPIKLLLLRSFRSRALACARVGSRALNQLPSLSLARRPSDLLLLCSLR